MKNIISDILLNHQNFFLDLKINSSNFINIDLNKLSFIKERNIIYIDKNNVFQNTPINNINDLIFKSIFHNIISYNYSILKNLNINDFLKYNISILNFLKNLPFSLFNNKNISFINNFFFFHNSLFDFKIIKNDNETIDDVYNDLNKNIFVFYKYDLDFIDILLYIYNFIFDFDKIKIFNSSISNLINYNKIKNILSIININKVYNSFNFNKYIEQLYYLLYY